MKSYQSYWPYIIVLLFAFLFTIQLKAQEIEWAVPAQGENEDLGTAVSADKKYIYHAGDIGNQVLFGEGELNETIALGENYVARYFHDGTLSWVSTIHSDGSPLNINGIGSDEDGNVYIAGSINTGHFYTFGSGEVNENTIDTGGNAADVFVAKYDASGLFEWVRQAGISELNVASDISVDAAGSSYITGFFRSSIVFGSEGSTPPVNLFSEGGAMDNDIFIVKYNTNGDLDWAKSAGGETGADTGFGIDLDHKNNVYVTGHFFRYAIFGKDAPTHMKELFSEGSFDVFIARFTAKGIPVWAISAGGMEADQGLAIVNRKGKSVILGRFNDTAIFGSTDGVTQQLIAQGTQDLFVARYNRAGRLLWVNDISMDILPNFNMDVGYGENQQSCVMGNFEGMATFGVGQSNEMVLNAQFNPDMYFGCYSGQGVFQWAEPDPVPLNAGTMTGAGEIIVTGGFQSTPAFGPGDPNVVELLVSEGGRDVFLAKYLSQKPEMGFTSDSPDITDVLMKSSAIPDGYILKKNYPNPFNPQTSIRFGLPEAAEVTLTVYDVTGRVVSSLIKGELGAGNHEVHFNAANLPSGLYLYRLVTPAGEFTKLMSLVK